MATFIKKPLYAPQMNDYFLVLDFEANGDHKRIYPMEIIEFPVLKVNAKTMEVESTFHTYVEPRVHKELSTFCTELTGITTEMVAKQPGLEVVLQRLDEWMQQTGLLRPEVKSVFVTCGDWDLKTQLPRETALWQLPLPDYCKRWVNIKRVFESVTKKKGRGMMEMLRALNIPHEGRHHSGIDDCKNIARILAKLVSMGADVRQTGQIMS